MRKTFFALLILLMLLMLTSCFSTANRPEEAKLSDDREVFLGWIEQKKLPPDGFWVLLQPCGDNSDEYEILSIAKNPLFVDVEKKQEQLYVDKDYKYVQPYFTDPMSTVAIIKDGLKEDAFDRGTWQCQYLKKYKTYSPCSSSLTKAQTLMSIAKNILSFQAYFLTAGTHRVVDVEKIKKIIIKTNLFAAIDKWKEGKWGNNVVESSQNMQKEITNANAIDPAKLRSLINERRNQQ